MARYDSDEPDYSEYHPETSIQAFTSSSHASAEAISLASEYALKNGDYNTAIALCRRAINKDNDDLDTHLNLAQAIEAKIKAQDERDQQLFKECVKEWLIVLRNTVGAEKGMDWHGLSLMGARYEDEFHGGVARTHLKQLVGSVPLGRETDTKYLKRVLNPANSTVSGKVVDSDRNKQQ
jgi:hypothetical protein